MDCGHTAADGLLDLTDKISGLKLKNSGLENYGPKMHNYLLTKLCKVPQKLCDAD